jgi:hypothetical protein
MFRLILLQSQIIAVYLPMTMMEKEPGTIGARGPRKPPPPAGGVAPGAGLGGAGGGPYSAASV